MSATGVTEALIIQSSKKIRLIKENQCCVVLSENNYYLPGINALAGDSLCFWSGYMDVMGQ